MAKEHPLHGLLHRTTHRIPAVPAHTEPPAGHHGTTVHDRVQRHGATPGPSLNHKWNHSPGRPARFMPAWQHRIATLFGQEL